MHHLIQRVIIILIANVLQRVSGADINPHLALAAILKCGYWGIETKQELPTGPSQTAVDQTGNERLARTLQEATVEMDKKDSVARKVLGDEFVDHYVSTRKHEWNLWQNTVTDYELKRYMELVQAHFTIKLYSNATNKVIYTLIASF